MSGASPLVLLSEAAEEQPLPAVVDDAHRLDHASARVLAFARRLLARSHSPSGESTTRSRSGRRGSRGVGETGSSRELQWAEAPALLRTPADDHRHPVRTTHLGQGERPVSICRCGGSSNKPFCDGTHATIDFDGTLAN
jgi:CDGSH-type Zn-finger protein